MESLAMSGTAPSMGSQACSGGSPDASPKAQSKMFWSEFSSSESWPMALGRVAKAWLDPPVGLFSPLASMWLLLQACCCCCGCWYVCNNTSVLLDLG